MNYSQKYGYVRVSSTHQNTDRQLDGLQLDRIFEEKVSGKNITERPILRNLLDFILRRGDELYVHSTDRLARSVEDLVRVIRLMREKGVKLHFVNENLSITPEPNPISDMVIIMLGVCAQFQRALIAEARDEGIAKAKERGAYKGRKAKFSAEEAEDLRKMHAEINNVSYLARYYKVSRTTIREYLKNNKDSNARPNLEINQRN